MHRPLLPLTLVAVAAVTALSAPTSAQQFRDETAARFPVPNPTEWTNQVTMGDLNGDGALDLIFANGGNFSSAGPNLTQRVYMNQGNGTFRDESAFRLNFSGLCRGVELGDIENDGDLDIIFVQDFNRQPQLFVNVGGGFFSNATASRLPVNLMSSSRAQFGDIDNDGDLDIYITDGGSNRFGCGQYRVWVNDGNGFFTDETATRHPIGNVCNNMDCIFGDIDNDFDLDVRTASTGSNNSRLYRNDGAGVFSLVSTPPDSSCYSYDFGDMDGDGDLDLIGANALSGSSAELLLENDGTGTYTNVSSQISPNISQDDNDTKFIDWDDDGDLDLLIGRIGGPEKSFVNNDGNGNFIQVTTIIEAVSDSTLDIIVGDVDNDGAYDVITGQGESGNYQNRIYYNQGPSDTHAPTIVDTETIADTADTAGPYVFRALILDNMTSDRNFFDKGIFANYTVNGGAVQQVPMRYSGGQVYRAELPGQSPGSTVEYFVTATDWANNTATGPAQTFQVEGALVGDIDGDGDVDFGDILALIGLWGPCPDPPADCPADLDGSGDVGFGDILLVIANWTV